MAILANLARMTTVTTGTGTVTLGAAASGFLTFAQAGIADGQVVSYAIEDIVSSSREVGRGTYTASGTTLTRGPLKSTNSNAAINLSGTAQVFITPLSEDFDGFRDETVQAVLNGGGAAIAAGSKGDLYIPYSGTITAVTLLADQAGSIVVDLWRDTYANYPPTIADTIVASAPPTISAATKSQDTTLTGWSTTVTAGQTLRLNVNSCSAITRCTVALTVRRT